MDPKKLLIFNILIFSIVIISGCATDDPLLETKLAFCEKTMEETQEILTSVSTDEFIEQSEYKDYLQVWKESFIHYNDITEDYFDRHIRIESVEIEDVPHGGGRMVYDPNPNRDKYLRINNYFIIDWISIPLKDGFLIKWQNSSDFLTIEEVKHHFRYIDIPERTKTDIQISWEVHLSYIRRHEGKTNQKTHGKLINTILSCKNAVSIMSLADNTLVPNQIGFKDMDFTMRASGTSNGDKCSSASLSLATGRMLYYYPDQPCMIT